MPSINFNNAKKVFYQGKEIKKIYALNQLVWEQKKTLNEMTGNFLSRQINNNDTEIFLNGYLIDIWGIPYANIKSVDINNLIDNQIYDVTFIEYRNNGTILYRLADNKRVTGLSYPIRTNDSITIYYD